MWISLRKTHKTYELYVDNIVDNVNKVWKNIFFDKNCLSQHDYWYT